jgi:hypothetical protein
MLLYINGKFTMGKLIQLIRYFSAYVSYLNFLERWLLLTRKATIIIKFLVYSNQIKNIGWRLTSFDRSRYIQSNLSYRAPLWKVHNGKIEIIFFVVKFRSQPVNTINF